MFSNKRKNKIKLLYWEDNGFAIWYKDLHKGVFKFPNTEQKLLEISAENIEKIIHYLT